MAKKQKSFADKTSGSKDKDAVYVKYVKRCVAGPGDTLQIKNKQVYINDVLSDLPENYVFSQPEIPKTMEQQGIYLSSNININKDNMGPVSIPKRGDYFKIDKNTKS